MTSPLRRLAALALALLLTPAFSAAAAPLLVADMKTGEVLEANQATTPWYPASLTKLMTTMVVLNAVKAGKITMQTPVVYSARAQAEPPSKMGFQVGQTVTVEDALKMLMVQSANDMCVALAELVSGSVEAFVVEMNRTARMIGMTNSNFVNPNGLPVKPGPDLARTTARDMAVLAMQLTRMHPEQAGLFSLSAIRIGDRTLRNHNGLLGRYPGADGMKTGYTCSAGFNVVATATRGDRRLVTVVLGSESHIKRSETAIDAFERGFASSGRAASTLMALQDVPAAFTIDMREQQCGAAAAKARAARAKLNPDTHPWLERLKAKIPVNPVMVYATPAPGATQVAAQPSGVDEDAPSATAPSPGVTPAIAGQTAKPGAKPAKKPAAKAKEAKAAKPEKRRDAKTGREAIDLKPAVGASAANGAQPVPGSIYRNAAPADGKSAF